METEQPSTSSPRCSVGTPWRDLYALHTPFEDEPQDTRQHKLRQNVVVTVGDTETLGEAVMLDEAICDALTLDDADIEGTVGDTVGEDVAVGEIDIDKQVHTMLG